MNSYRNNTFYTPFKRIQADFYLSRLKVFGINTAYSVGWSDYLQAQLFEKLMKVLSDIPSDKPHTLLDAGCGLGDFMLYLNHHGYSKIIYHGIDIIPEMILSAQEKYPGSDFKVADFSDSSFKTEYDYIVCSGAMNILAARNRAGHEKFIQDFIRKMYSLSRIGCAFNLLTQEGKDFFPEDEIFYYADRLKVYRFCSGLSAGVSMDYQEHDYTFTIIMHKK
jgi:SAM-dependent methyltransferase